MSDTLIAQFVATRRQSEEFCEPLATEDYGLQAAAFTSPPKWHLAHTSWFFETFLLKPFVKNYQTPDEKYELLFNSYYNGIGQQYPRPDRGLLSRPVVAEIMEYRKTVTDAICALLQDESHSDRSTVIERSRLGIEHERQHQELFFTDLKYSFAKNPFFPVYAQLFSDDISNANVTLKWKEYKGGLVEIGHKSENFAFDNELPRHKSYIEPFMLANRLVSNSEYQQFIDDGGYQRPELWLADGWLVVQRQGWQQPLYWHEIDGVALEYTLHGLKPRNAHQPVCHISGYEADAYARWAKARLPTEMEWEHAASFQTIEADGVDNHIYHPQPAKTGDALLQLYSDCWQWTQSAYSPYPGFKPAQGAIGEYNGKFMSNQWVLRGGSCVSKKEHLRTSYRNFFYPHERWQFSGIRLARSA